MESVTLSAGVRANLLALQDTAQSMRTSQERLATGKRVNSAIDAPINFFSAQSLSSRAGALSGLIDQMGQAQQTLQVAADGIAAQMTMVQSAIAVAERIKQAPLTAIGYSSWTPFVGTVPVTPAAATTITGAADMTNFSSITNGAIIRVGGVPYTVVSTGFRDFDQFISDINNSPGLGPSGAATASKDPSGRYLVLTSNSAATMTVDPIWGGALAAGLVNPNLAQVVPGLAGTSLTVQANNAPPRTIVFGNGSSGICTYGDLKQALAGSNVDAYVANNPPTLEFFIPGSNMLNTPQTSISLGGTALGPLGITAGTKYGQLVGSPDPTRAALAQQYNALIGQVDQVAADASYRGVNLLKGNNLDVAFNENGSSSLSISGANDSANGLGLYTVPSDGLQTNEDVDAHLTSLVSAIDTLRTQASQLGSNLGVVQVRKEFTNRMVSTLQTGADNLVLNDSNQEGANLLALQTRQQLSTTALSLSAQSDQAVLRLFS